MSTPAREPVRSENNASSRREKEPTRGRRCTCGDGTCAACRAAARLQLQATGRSAGPLEGEADSAAASAVAGDPVGPLSPVAGESPPASRGSLLADDAAAALTPGQVRKETFLAELRAAICAAAEEELAGTGRSTDGCPELDYWFTYYELRSADQIERAIRRYAPETSDAASASDLLPPLVERVRAAVRVWVATGRVSGVPEELSLARLGADAVPGGAAEAFSENDRLLLSARESSAAADGPDPEAVRSELGPGRPLDARTRARMESSFGHGFGSVRIHDDGAAAALATRLGARAFAVGDDVGFGAGEYRPGSIYGTALLAHELAHTVQQRGGKGTGGAAHEADATSAARGALTAGRATVGLRTGLALQRCDRGTTSSKDAGPPPTGSATPTQTPTQTPQPQPQQQGPPPVPTAACTRGVAPGAVVADHRASRQTIESPGETTTFTVTFSCQIRGEGWSEIVDSAGNTVVPRQRIGSRGDGQVTRSWDGKKFFTDIGTYMVDDGQYRHKITEILYAFGAPPRRGAQSPDLRITENLSPPVTIRTRGNVAAAPTTATTVPATSHFTAANTAALGEIVNSETGTGNQQEQEAVAWAVRNQMVRMNTHDVTAARTEFVDAHDQATTPAFTALAERILRLPMSADVTGGSIKWFSPKRFKTERPGLDTRGGRITVNDLDGNSQTVFAPSWHRTMHFVAITGVRDWNLRFYRL